MTERSSAAAVIADARRRAGLSQGELSRRTGVARTAIGRWERGEVEPSFSSVVELLRAAGWEIRFEPLDPDHHDLSLIVQELARTPAERLANLGHGVRAIESMVDTANRHRERQAASARAL